MKRKRQSHQSLRSLVDGGDGRRASFTLSPTTLEQIAKLAKLYNITPAAVVSSAIATRFYSDPLAQANAGVAAWFFDPNNDGDQEEVVEERPNGAHHSEL